MQTQKRYSTPIDDCHVARHLFSLRGEMESNSTDPTDRSVLKLLAVAIVAVEDGDTDAADTSTGHSDERNETATSSDENDRSIPAAVGVPDDTAEADNSDSDDDSTADAADDDSGRPTPDA
jgi:hypothetical protein